MSDWSKNLAIDCIHYSSISRMGVLYVFVLWCTHSTPITYNALEYDCICNWLII